MASYTATQDGLWSQASTWGGSGVPGNGDTVTIPAGRTVTFDVDQSSFASGLAGLTVDGVLSWKTDTVTYLKMATDINIGGTGTLQVGRPDNRIQRPAQGSQVRATIKLQGSHSKITTPNIYAYGWDERLNRTTLAANASAGATQVVLTDDLNLQAGDQILIGAGTVNDYMTESAKGVYTVSSYDQSTRTVTLTGALGHGRLAGDYVGVYNRTIFFDTVRNPSFESYTPGYYRFEGATIRNSIGWVSTLNIPLADGVLADKCTFMSRGMYGGQYGPPYTVGPYTVQNSTFYNSDVYWSQNTTFKDCTFIHRESAYEGFVAHSAGAVFDSCWFQNARAVVYKNTAWGYGFSQHRSCKARNLQSGAYAHFPHRMICYDMDFGSFTPVDSLFHHHRLYDCLAPTISISYGGATLEGALESFNHNQVPGEYRLYQYGGVTLKVTDIPAPGRTYSHKTSLTSTYSPAVVGRPLGVLDPGETLVLTAWIRKDKTSAEMPYTPRVQVLRGDNWINKRDLDVLKEALMDSSKVNEWDKVVVKYRNTESYPVRVSGRVKMMGSTGNVWHVLGEDVTSRGKLVFIK